MTVNTMMQTEAKCDAQVAGWIAHNRTIGEWLFSDERTHPFLGNMQRAVRRFGHLTERQHEAVEKWRMRELAEAERAVLAAQAIIESGEEEVEKPILVAGRQTIEGEVISTKYTMSQFGEQFKMLIELNDGSGRLFGTVPASLGNIERGAQVTFQATVTISNDDARFGFYSRPTKATRL